MWKDFTKFMNPDIEEKQFSEIRNRMEFCMGWVMKVFSGGHNCKKELSVGCFGEITNCQGHSMFKS